jgi:hypothetical protein
VFFVKADSKGLGGAKGVKADSKGLKVRCCVAIAGAFVSETIKELSADGVAHSAKLRESLGLERRKMVRGLGLGTLRGSHSLR